MRGRRLFGKRSLVAVGIAAAALVSAPQAALSDHRAFRTAIVAQDFAFRGIPAVLPAGTYDTRFLNIGQAPHVVVAINLGASCAGLTEAELVELFDGPEEAAFEHCPDISIGGDIFTPGGTRAQGSLVLTPGRNVFVCFVGRHYAQGMMSFTNVINVG
jgi:hypothetical protein